MKRSVLAVGDVFLVPLGPDRSAAGQVVARYGDAYYFAVFERSHALSGPPEPADAVRDHVSLLALSLDARVRDGTWTVIGNVPVSGDIRLPVYREAIGSPDQADVVDHTGTLRRRASVAEASALPTRKIVAPIRLERAARAKAGLEPWQDGYSEFEPANFASGQDAFSPRRGTFH